MRMYRRHGKTMLFACAVLLVWFGSTYFMSAIVYKTGDMATTQAAESASGASLNFTAVVIVAYMRSGSTFLGNIVQHDPSVFYVFEPLRQLHKVFHDSVNKQFGNRIDFKNRRPAMILRRETLNILRAWILCDIKSLLSSPRRLFLEFFNYGHKTHEILKCLGIDDVRKKNCDVNECKVDNNTCIQLLRTRCLESKLRIIKTVRTPMDWLYELMNELPNTKILHLVRDPRAVANSLTNFEGCDTFVDDSWHHKCIQEFCARLEDDLTPYDMYKKLFPTRMLRIYYEELAFMPIGVAEKIYNNIGLVLSDRTKEYIHNITMSGNKPAHILDTVRSDSRQNAERWRSNLSIRTVNIVQSFCQYSMFKLQYKKN